MDPQILREAMTAYEAVYNEDLREEIDFQNWVNSLVEEGYDLSDYTWEEMYEAYIDEAPNLGTGGTAQDMINRREAAKNKAGGTLGAGGGQAAMRKLQSQGVDARSAYARVYTQGERNLSAAAKPPAAKPPAAKPAAPAASAPAARPASTAAARPAASAPAARPASTAAARPAASAPRPSAAPAARPSGGAPMRDTPLWGPGSSGSSAAKPPSAKPAPTTTSKPITSQPPESKSQAAAGEIRGMIGRSMERQAASAPVAKPTPTPTRRPMGSVKPGSLVSGFDMFDVVKGYLIDEGFAETEESAIAIMANMSEEWKLEIIDEAVKGESSDRRRALAAERRKGIKPLSAKEGEKYATHKIAQMAYAKRAKMGDDD